MDYKEMGSYLFNGTIGGPIVLVVAILLYS